MPGKCPSEGEREYVPAGSICTMKDAFVAGRETLRQAGIADADLDAWYLLEYAAGIDRAHYLADPLRQMDAESAGKYREYITSRAGRIPLQHITGEQEFMGLSFRVNRHVLIPRQDTEVLVEQALGLLEKDWVPYTEAETGRGRTRRILDLCTGSGCILLSILHWKADSRDIAGENRQNQGENTLYGTGADVSPEALEVAEENARRLEQKNAEFICSDLFENVTGTFGMIVSNPPYVRTAEIDRLEEEVRLHDPLLALDGKEDGLWFYREIIKDAGTYLENSGWLLFETGFDQAEEVSGLMRSAGFVDISAVKDLAGLDRVVMGRRPA